VRRYDNELVGYSVDGRRRRIVLHTEDVHRQNPHPRIDVVFESVEFYQFRYATLVSIVFDVQEHPMRRALEKRAAEFDEAFRRSGWPDRWETDPVPPARGSPSGVGVQGPPLLRDRVLVRFRRMGRRGAGRVCGGRGGALSGATAGRIFRCGAPRELAGEIVTR
jgi:hypothetical protein